MKKIILIFIAFLSFSVFALAGCNEEDKTYMISIEQTTGGLISADRNHAKVGEIINVAITPNDGYYLESLTYNNLSFRYNFEMPNNDVVIKGTFVKYSNNSIVHDVVVDQSYGGQVSVNCLKAEVGKEIIIDVIPNENFVLDYIEVNDEVLHGTSFQMPNFAVNIYVCFVVKSNLHNLIAQNSRYGKVIINRSECYSSGTILVDYIPLTGYVLDYFTINNENVGVNPKLIMPDEDAIVSAVFKKVFEDTSVVITSEMSNGSATSYWYFNYTKTGLDILVKVEDPLLILTGEPHYRDYVECIVDISPQQAEWNIGKTVKLTVTADGTCYMRTAVSKTAFGKENFEFDSSLWNGTSMIKKLSNKDGYSGYEVKFHISYDLFGMNYNECVNKIIVMPAMNNSESFYAGKWVAYNKANWFNMFTYLMINSNGEIN